MAGVLLNMTTILAPKLCMEYHDSAYCRDPTMICLSLSLSILVASSLPRVRELAVHLLLTN